MHAIEPIPAHLQAMPKPSANAPIGIFDSGIGGLSVAIEVLKHLPQEQVLYYADTAHVPYGTREDADIRLLTAQAIEWLYRQGCKVAIVACNTASAFSLDYLRSHYGAQFPIIGLVPAVKPAVIQTVSKVVGVLATPATFRGQLIRDVIKNFALPAGVEVVPVVSLELVPLIEQGQADSVAMQKILQHYLDPLMVRGADHLVLGCTHYPFLKQAITHIYGDKLALVDSGIAVARQCGRVLAKSDLLNASSLALDMPSLTVVLSGNDRQVVQPIVERLIVQKPTWSFIDLLHWRSI